MLEDLDGVLGDIFRVNSEARRFVLLKETAVDPKGQEGSARHDVFWTEATRFTKLVRQNNFEGIEGTFTAYFRNVDEKNVKAAAAGEPLVVLHVTLLATGEDGAGLKLDEQNFLAPFTPDPNSSMHRGGTIELKGRRVAVRLRGPRAEVNIRTPATEKDIRKGAWSVRLRGERQDGRFVAGQMEISPRVDPREVDDPELPRILVIGDSISMNYHRAAQEALRGVANYWRIEGNGGPSDRGLACIDLWLGDYTQVGLKWDLIQFNHGLHDLKQAYDEVSGEYGTHQVPVEEYKDNLEKLIQAMQKTGARLVWCTTTPVPQSSHGRWANGTFGRRKDEDLVYNNAALEVIRKYPEIEINDLNAFIRSSPAFNPWREQKDVHFWDRPSQDLVGNAVAVALKRILEE